jgi:hypothetical protein
MIQEGDFPDISPLEASKSLVQDPVILPYIDGLTNERDFPVPR